MISRAISIREPTDVAEARRRGKESADRARLDENAAERVAICVTELATNILRHATSGEIVVSLIDGRLEVLALDKGKGMANVQVCLSDGFSTGGTRGEGLGAVARQADAFDIYSQPGLGTAVLARFGKGEDPPWSGVNVPYPGETVCGDDWQVTHRPGSVDILVADGLGHGLLASEAAKAAVAAFDKRGDMPPAEFLSFAQGALRPTRGAAVAVARLTASGVEFAGIGNIAGTVWSTAGARKMISHNGTLGHVAKRFQSFAYPTEPSSIVIMHSDGLGSSWNLERYPGLMGADPALIAGVLYRDFNRGRDDVTVVAAKGPSQ